MAAVHPPKPTNDAEAIVPAACPPEMRFVAPKTVEQQSRAAVFRGWERLVHQRTADVNALRALLYEHGHVLSAGIRPLNRMRAIVGGEASDLPALIREECQDLRAQIAKKTERIVERTKKLKMLAKNEDYGVRRWQSRHDTHVEPLAPVPTGGGEKTTT